MTFSTDMAAVALSLINQFGGDCSIVRTTGGTLDPVTRRMSGQINTVIDTVAVREDRKTWGEGGRLVTETVLLTVTEPMVGDVVTFAGSTLRVTRVSAIAPSGGAIVYEATVSL